MTPDISTFNPLTMSDKDIVSTVIGRDFLLKLVILEMTHCLDDDTNHHFLFHGPRGIGKTFFTKILKISHDSNDMFKDSVFIQFPEEQDNIRYVSDVLEMICIKLGGEHYSKVFSHWILSDNAWDIAKRKLQKIIKEKKRENKNFHLFFSLENLQDFIPNMDKIENGRLRDFLEQFGDITLIGTSLRPDLDNDYNKRLFQVFKKYEIKPWSQNRILEYYNKRVSLLPYGKRPSEDLQQISENRIQGIATFSKGNPRLAVILIRLILENNIISTNQILLNLVDDLTPYYQDLTKRIPRKSRILFDTLIRHGENMTQSKLAETLGQHQNTIAKSFRWLIDNFYVDYVKQQSGNVRFYFVKDRIYTLYYQYRQALQDQQMSVIGLVSDFLVAYNSSDDLKSQARILIIEEEELGQKLMDIDSNNQVQAGNINDEGDIRSSLVGEPEVVYGREGERVQKSVQSVYWLITNEKWQDLLDVVKSSDGEVFIGIILYEATKLAIVDVGRPQSFYLISRTLESILNAKKLRLYNYYFINICARLNQLREHALMEDLFSEYENNTFFNSQMLLFIKALRHLQSPSDHISALHPDVRLIVDMLGKEE